MENTVKTMISGGGGNLILAKYLRKNESEVSHNGNMADFLVKRT